MPRTSKRQLILESAAAIINEKGADYLTLDAVAQRAGISKGGLFYHFKSKDELIKELVNYANNLYRDNVNQHIDNEKNKKGQWLNAFIEATRAHRTDKAPITSGMLAAQGTNRSLLSPLKTSYQEWQYQITHDGLDEVDATIIRLAVDGLWLSEIFGISAIDEEMREKVIERLKRYGSLVYDTQQNGEMTINLDKHHLNVMNVKNHLKTIAREVSQ